MDIMTRRAMMPNDNYIKNGLILWMDGIDKGSISGAWVDKAKGHIFTNVNGMTNGSNYVGLDGSQMQHFKNNTFTTPMTYLGSIEVVISDYATDTTQLIFMPKDNDDSRLGFAIRNSGEIIYAVGTSRQRWPIINNAKTFSIANYLRALENGQEVTITNNYSDLAGCDRNYNYIGYRNYATNYSCFTGKIYSIRIYNRYLTKSEMRHNQRIDNKRFKLGINNRTIDEFPMLIDNMYFNENNAKIEESTGQSENWCITGFYDTGSTGSKSYTLYNPHNIPGIIRLYNDKTATSVDWWEYSSGTRTITSVGRYIAFDVYKPLAGQYYIYDNTNGRYVAKGSSVT